MTKGHNHLTALAGDISDAHTSVTLHVGIAAQKALEAGAKLVEAKAMVKHGQWLAFVKQCGMAERTAQRYMTLARSGYDSAMVAGLGMVRSEKLANDASSLAPEPGKALTMVFDSIVLVAWPSGRDQFLCVVNYNSSNEFLYLEKPIPIGFLCLAMTSWALEPESLVWVEYVPKGDVQSFIDAQAAAVAA